MGPQWLLVRFATGAGASSYAVEMTGRVVFRCGASVFFGVPALLGLSVATSDADTTCDGQSCVPNVGQGATVGDPCGNADRYVYSTTGSGQLVACADSGNRMPTWVVSAPLVGVRGELSPCSPADAGVAQTPSGQPLQCVIDGSASGGRWTVPS